MTWVLVPTVVDRHQYQVEPPWRSDHVPYLSVPRRPCYATQSYRRWSLEPCPPAPNHPPPPPHQCRGGLM